MNPPLAVLVRAVLTACGLAVTALPRSWELRLGPWLGRLFLLLDSRRRRIASDNISRCFPKLGPTARERLLRENYDHYGILALELLHMFSPLPGHYRAYTQRTTVLEGFENWQKAHDKGRGVLFISAHLANWELGLAQSAMHGMPLTIATRRLKPGWVHRKVEAARLSAGARAAYLPDTLPTLLKALRRRETIGFAMDQYAPPPMGIPVRFFGVGVDTLAAVGILAARYGAPIIPATQTRGADGVVRTRIEPELELGEARQDAERATQAISDKVEAWIRAEPAQWLWVHRRFKNTSTGTAPRSSP